MKLRQDLSKKSTRTANCGPFLVHKRSVFCIIVPIEVEDEKRRFYPSGSCGRKKTNKEKYREYWQKYYKKNKKKIMENQAAYWARRLEKLKSK